MIGDRSRRSATFGGQYPPVIGTPAASLRADASWARNETVAAMGMRGEQLTAAVLDRFACRGGPTVAHDLRMPIVGSSANIDHALVTGRDVWLLDAKLWLPGVYWTWHGQTRRGGMKIPHADGSVMSTSAKAIAQYLSRLGVKANVRPPLIVVWPSRKGSRASVLLYRPKDAIAVSGPSLRSKGRRLFSGAPADQRIVSALAGLLNHPLAAEPPSGTDGYDTASDAGWETGA